MALTRVLFIVGEMLFTFALATLAIVTAPFWLLWLVWQWNIQRGK